MSEDTPHYGEMNEQRARELLRHNIEADDKLFPRDAGNFHVCWLGDSFTDVRGRLTADELEAIAWWMRNKMGPRLAKKVDDQGRICGLGVIDVAADDMPRGSNTVSHTAAGTGRLTHIPLSKEVTLVTRTDGYGRVVEIGVNDAGHIVSFTPKNELVDPATEG